MEVLILGTDLGVDEESTAAASTRPTLAAQGIETVRPHLHHLPPLGQPRRPVVRRPYLISLRVRELDIRRRKTL